MASASHGQVAEKIGLARKIHEELAGADQAVEIV
jgi:hypothetical protein